MSTDATPVDAPREVVPEDDSFHHHEKSASPWWNESAWFGFMIPERKIDAYFYMWHRPNMKLTSAGVAIWDPYGEERHNCLYADWYNFNDLRPDSDMFNYELTNGMSCEVLEPLWRYKLRYQSPACDIDLLWAGIHPPQELNFKRSKGFEEYGGFHYEQIGKVTGTIRVEDEVMEVDGHHVRDRSWGLRERYRDYSGGGVEFGWASERTSFCTTMARPEPAADLLAVSVDVPGYGHFVKDGKIGKLVSGERRVTKRRPDGCPLEFALDLRDEHGREMHATGTMQNTLKWDDLWFVHWGLVKWTIDGEEGWGETQDWLAHDQIRAQQRSFLKQGSGFGGRS
jgi:hypothetical protein